MTRLMTKMKRWYVFTTIPADLQMEAYDEDTMDHVMVR
jgi:hypothetical protein